MSAMPDSDQTPHRNDAMGQDRTRERRRVDELPEDAFIAVGTGKIEQMRLRTNEDGFFHHQFCFFCSD
jgi:hypothetical protein